MLQFMGGLILGLLIGELIGIFIICAIILGRE